MFEEKMDQFFDSLKAGHHMEDYRSEGRRTKDDSHHTSHDKPDAFVDPKRDTETNLTVCIATRVAFCGLKIL